MTTPEESLLEKVERLEQVVRELLVELDTRENDAIGSGEEYLGLGSDETSEFYDLKRRLD